MQRILNQQDEKNFLIECQIFLSVSMAQNIEQPKGLISTTSKGPNQESNISYAPEPGVAERSHRRHPIRTSYFAARQTIVSGLRLM